MYKLFFLLFSRVSANSGTIIPAVCKTGQRDKQVVATLLRGYFTMLQGACFCLSGHYRKHGPLPLFNEHQHEAIHWFSMMLGLYFILVVILIFLAMLAVGWLAKRITERSAQRSIDSNRRRNHD